MMTLTDWLARFAAGTAQLPGWQLQHGHLRRYASPLWHCPLSAEWNAAHPNRLCGPAFIKARWRRVLDNAAMDQLIEAADDPATEFPLLRAALLAACGITEEDLT